MDKEKAQQHKLEMQNKQNELHQIVFTEDEPKIDEEKYRLKRIKDLKDK